MTRLRRVLCDSVRVWLAAGALIAAAPAEAQLWQRAENGAQGGPVAVEAGGDVVVGFVSSLAKLVVMRLDGATGAEVWRYETASGFAEEVVGVALSGGDVVAAGTITNTDRDIVAVKVDLSTGDEIWRADVDGGDSDEAAALATDGAGDVVVVGFFGDFVPFASDFAFAVVKLDGTDGTESWRASVDGTGGGEDFARAVAVDAADDVVAVGQMYNSATGYDGLVLKLDGASGGELWRREVDGANTFDFAHDVAVDSAGDVVLVGIIAGPAFGSRGARKFDGGTGADVWSALPQTQATRVVAVGTDLVVGAVGITGAAQVVRLDGTDGDELWETGIAGTADGNNSHSAEDLALDGLGGVLVAGTLENARDTSVGFVTKLAVASGAELWRREFGDFFGSESLAVDAAGDVFVSQQELPVHRVMRLDGSNGGDVLPSGRRLRVHDRDGDPSRRRVIAAARDVRVELPQPGSAGDPTLGAGMLVLRNPTTNETATFALPAAGWSGRGTPAGSKGWVYTDPGGANGPCKKVQLRRGAFSARCAGASIGFTLDEPSQGSLALELVIGSGALRHCYVFGGDVHLDSAAVGGSAGYFFATDAAAATACP